MPRPTKPKFYAADLQLLLLSSNQDTVVHRKWNSNVVFTLSHFLKIVGWCQVRLELYIILRQAKQGQEKYIMHNIYPCVYLACIFRDLDFLWSIIWSVLYFCLAIISNTHPLTSVLLRM